MRAAGNPLFGQVEGQRPLIVYGWDIPAVLMTAAAMGVSDRLLTDVLGPIEDVLIHVNRSGD